VPTANDAPLRISSAAAPRRLDSKVAFRFREDGGRGPRAVGFTGVGTRGRGHRRRGAFVHVLVVEDDPAIAGPIERGLARAGFTTEHVSTGAGALAAGPADLILLDLGLPDLDGTEVCRRLCARSTTPIIVVSARDDEVDRVVGLELGADDYVVKPFGMRELVARVRAVLRRAGEPPEAPTVPSGSGAAPSGTTEIGDLRIDRRARRVALRATEVALTPKEFDVLALLASDPGAVFRREEIIDRVWDTNWYGSTRTLDVHVAALRRKLGDPRWVETVRGVGFRLGVGG
jgi:two-component system, OmpR family, response regulator RegX3